MREDFVCMCHFLPWILRFTITIVLIISARWVDVFFSCHLENWFVIPIHQQLALTLDIDAWMSERSGWNMFTPYRWIVWENRIFTSRKQSIIIWWRDLISVYNLRENICSVRAFRGEERDVQTIILPSRKTLAARHKFAYQVIRSLVSIRHFIFK